MGNLATPKSVQKLQTALHAKAKAEAGYRFYALYDKISRDDILAHAYAQCRSNKGAPGIDGQDFAGIEVYGVERWLAELALALRQGTYRPEPIRRVYIPKANGKLRPLGISSVRDRVCMTAATLVLEPIFEADLPLEQYAYRPGRNAQQAAVEVEELLFRGYREVVDADLADFFGSIPHTELMKSVARRVVDRRVLHLIKMWHLAFYYKYIKYLTHGIQNLWCSCRILGWRSFRVRRCPRAGCRCPRKLLNVFAPLLWPTIRSSRPLNRRPGCGPAFAAVRTPSFAPPKGHERLRELIESIAAPKARLAAADAAAAVMLSISRTPPGGPGPRPRRQLQPGHRAGAIVGRRSN